MHLQEIIDQLKTDERNASYTARGIGPIFQIHEKARILIIGQAPGKKVEESGIPFHDKSGEKLMAWMGIDSQTFYSPAISIMPMDFPIVHPSPLNFRWQAKNPWFEADVVPELQNRVRSVLP